MLKPKCKHCENFTDGNTLVNYYSIDERTNDYSQGCIDPIYFCPACGRNINIRDYALPENKNMYDCCHCVAECAYPCGRKQKPKEKIFTASDFSEICLNFVDKRPQK